MNFNKTLLDTLFQRQSCNLNFSSKYYENQIVKAFYESKKLFKKKLDFDEDNWEKIAFSKDGNYFMAYGDSKIKIWSLNDELFSNFNLKETCSINSRYSVLEHNYDLSKIYVYNYMFRRNPSFSVIDVTTNKKMKLIKLKNDLDCPQLSLCPMNENIVSFVEYESKEIQILDTRNSALQSLKINEKEVLYSINSFQYHPTRSYLFLMTSCDKVAFTFDIRNQKIDFFYNSFESSICASKSKKSKFNKAGDQFFVTERYMNPGLYQLYQADPLFEFTEFGFYNFKSGLTSCFAGIDDKYIVSHSDFNVYVWEICIPKINQEINSEKQKSTKKVDFPKYILKGHKSIINNVCYNQQKNLLASVDDRSKIIFWSCLPFDSPSKLDKSDFSDYSPFKKIKFGSSDSKSSIFCDYFSLKIKLYFFSSQLYSFNFELKKENLENLEIESFIQKFSDNPYINYFKRFINNYETDEKMKICELMKKIDDDIEKGFLKHDKTMHLNQMSLINETLKVHKTKYNLRKSINFLENQLQLIGEFEMMKNKNIVSDFEINFFKKIKLTMRSISDDFKLILKENISFYCKSTYYVKNLIVHVCGKEIIRPCYSLDYIMNSKEYELDLIKFNLSLVNY